MKKRAKEKYESDKTVSSQDLLSRKDFIKKAFTVGAAITIPISILPGCSDSSSDPVASGSNNGTSKSTFEITFSEPMDTASVEEAISIDPPIPGFFDESPVWSQNDTVVMYECAESVTAGDYTLIIAGTAAKDTAGNFLDGNNNGTEGDDYSSVVAL